MDADETKINRRAALWALAMGAGGLTGLTQLHNRLPRDESGVPTLFRKTHEFNEGIARAVLAPARGRDREFDKTSAIEPKNNYHGGTPEPDLDAWRLHFEERELTLADLKKLPEVTQTTELKCVEGWSAITTWTGVRLADFFKAFPSTASFKEIPKYVSLRSEPEGFEGAWYYVGLDLESCEHPQTLLAYGMNGAPLTVEHGAPLRLIIPHKYGIKNIKLITHIALDWQRPADYWAEQGYDWYAGL